MTSEEFINAAKEIITYETFPGNKDNIKLVWFSKILQNYKCILVDLRIIGVVPIHDINEHDMNKFVEPEFKPSGKIYECTFNGNKNEIYLDTYTKDNNCLYHYTNEVKRNENK